LSPKGELRRSSKIADSECNHPATQPPGHRAGDANSTPSGQRPWFQLLGDLPPDLPPDLQADLQAAVPRGLRSVPVA